MQQCFRPSNCYGTFWRYRFWLVSQLKSHCVRRLSRRPLQVAGDRLAGSGT
ncbi:hypothetical protein I8752_26695 [Nostocaceae cyanobacterium CENA369]|uniref:Uncharacterized protein n=1 Tax=Dendronalium phyllosphericum CENA369 TaxID=1725256 RepID=A0A8J7LI59_9NOST|nr:hypothetical protein [Dendronalium phyllosphericum]MBH8576514.1 hypothetical protein [Dendronalium phyllosphericum CENA369]